MDQFHWSGQQLLNCNLEAIDHAFTDGKTKKEIRKKLLQGYPPDHYK